MLPFDCDILDSDIEHISELASRKAYWGKQNPSEGEVMKRIKKAGLQ